MADYYIQKNKPRWLIVPILIALVGLIVYALPDKAPEPKVDLSGNTGDFLKKYCKTAVAESKAFKIPASVILAVAAVNSECYDHPEHHNLFNLAPDTNWEGEVITYAAQEGGEYTIRKYDTAWGSFRDFSITVTDYANIQGIDKEYLTIEGWIKLMNDAGLCNGDMKTVIDRYQLTVLDKLM